MTFAIQMRALRILREMSQQELATRSGIPINYLSMIETAKLMPGADYEARIRAALAWPTNADEAFRILASPSPAEAFADAFVEKVQP